MMNMTSEQAIYAADREEYSTAYRPRRRTTPKIVAAATNIKLFLAMLCMTTSAALEQECSCAPREYTFRLNFSGICPPRTPPPPNDYFGSGVKEYTCSIGDSPVQDSTRKQATNRDPIRRHLDIVEGGDRLDETQLHEIFPELQISTQTIADQIPVIVSSVQFIQQDKKGNPIESTLRSVDKADGETVRFISSIVTKPEQIVYRITMILRGFNQVGQAIQNKFTIEFTNTCGVSTFTEGEQIGWVFFEKLVPASDETCPGLLPPSRQPTPYFPPYYPSRSSGKSGKVYSSKKSSKASSSSGKSGKGGSGKSGKSKSAKGGYRNLRAVRAARGAGMNESRREQHTTMTKKYLTRNESVGRHLRPRSSQK